MACDSPFFVKPNGYLKEIPMPCGKCPPCKRRRINSWVFRLEQEDKVSLSSHFITLTYDTRYVPISENGFMTLNKTDFQKFMKRLRHDVPNATLKYYLAGEYGDKNSRPHYHLILFNLPDVELIAKHWTLGAVHIGQVTGDSIAYTAKYIDKEKRIPLHRRDDRLPEFSLMSKKLGENYLTSEIISYHKNDVSRNYIVKPDGHKIALPRYYREKIYNDHDKAEQRKLIIAQNAHQHKLHEAEFKRLYPNTTLSFSEYQELKRLGRYQSFYSNQKSRQ